MLLSKLDLKDAHLQTPSDDASRDLTANNTPYEPFYGSFSPFGQNLSPDTFGGVTDGRIVINRDARVHASIMQH